MVRHELALLRVSCFMGLIMFGGMSSLFYTQITGIISVSQSQPSFVHFIPFSLSCISKTRCDLHRSLQRERIRPNNVYLFCKAAAGHVSFAYCSSAGQYDG